MSDKNKWSLNQAEHLLEQLAESIASATPEEIAEDVRSSGEDADKLAVQAKDALLSGVKKFQQEKLHAARRRYQSNIAAIEGRRPRIAESAETRRLQFFALLQRNPDLGSALTLQHRDFNALTDEDIRSALDELDALGALDELGESSDGSKP